MIRLKAMFWKYLKQEKNVKRRPKKKPERGTQKVFSDDILNTK